MNWPVKCEICQEEFDSMDSYADSKEMLRTHMKNKHPITVLMVCKQQSKYSDHPAAKCNFSVGTDNTEEAMKKMREHWEVAHG